MNPVTLETVTDPLIYTIGKIGFALATALAIAFILIVFIRREKNSDKLVNWFAVIALGTAFVFGVMAAIGVEIYNNDREEVAKAALSAVEDTNGVTLLEADEITYKSLQRPNSIIPVTIDLDGDIFDGRLRVDDNGTITLLAPNPQDVAIMIPFNREEYLTTEETAAEEEEAVTEFGGDLPGIGGSTNQS